MYPFFPGGPVTKNTEKNFKKKYIYTPFLLFCRMYGWVGMMGHVVGHGHVMTIRTVRSEKRREMLIT